MQTTNLNSHSWYQSVDSNSPHTQLILYLKSGLIRIQSLHSHYATVDYYPNISQLKHYDSIYLWVESFNSESTFIPRLHDPKALRLEIYLMLEDHHSNWTSLPRVSPLWFSSVSSPRVLLVKAFLGLTPPSIWHPMPAKNLPNIQHLIPTRASTISICLASYISCLLRLPPCPSA